MEVTPNFKETVNKKTHNKWDREAKKWLSRLQIDYCEVRLKGCMGSFGLTPAHSKKRRKIRSAEAYAEIVAACAYCHPYLDQKMSHEEMEATVKRIIRSRHESPTG